MSSTLHVFNLPQSVSHIKWSTGNGGSCARFIDQLIVPPFFFQADDAFVHQTYEQFSVCCYETVEDGRLFHLEFREGLAVGGGDDSEGRALAADHGLVGPLVGPEVGRADNVEMVARQKHAHGPDRDLLGPDRVLGARVASAFFGADDRTAMVQLVETTLTQERISKES